MLDLLTKRHFEAHAENDLVVFSVGHAEEKYSFPMAFNISQDVRLNCKQAMRFVAQHHSIHREIADINRYSKIMSLLAKMEVNPEYRRTRQPGYRTCVGYEKELITYQIGNTTLKMHWEDGLKLSAMLRGAAKIAKKWSGTTGGRMRLVSILTDAEDWVNPYAYGNTR